LTELTALGLTRGVRPVLSTEVKPKEGIILNYCGITQVKLVPKQTCHKEIYEILEMAYNEV